MNADCAASSGTPVVAASVGDVSQSEIERPDRRRVVAEARHSSELEGARSTDALRADEDGGVELSLEEAVVDSTPGLPCLSCWRGSAPVMASA